MSKADEAHARWASANRATGPNRDLTVWRAACEWQREHDLEAVEGEQLEHDRENCNDRPNCDDCAYQGAIQDAVEAIKGA